MLSWRGLRSFKKISSEHDITTKFIFVLLSVSWALFLIYPEIFSLKGSYLRIHDVAESNLAYRVALYRGYIESGVFSVLSGVDAKTINTPSPFSLGYILFKYLDPYVGFISTLFLQRLLGFAFTYLVCRSLFKISVSLSLFSAISYTYCNGNIQTWTLYDRLGLPLIPLYVFFFDRIKKDNYAVLSLLLGAFSGFTTFYPLFTPYFSIVLWIWLIVCRDKDVFLTTKSIALYLAMSTIIFYPTLLDLLSSSENSMRMLKTYENITFSSGVGVCLEYFNRIWSNYRYEIYFLALGFLISRDRKDLFKVSASLIIIMIISNLFWLLSSMNRSEIGPIRAFNFNELSNIVPFLFAIAMPLSLSKLSHSFRFGRIVVLAIAAVFSYKIVLGIKNRNNILMSWSKSDSYARVFENDIIKEFVSNNDTNRYKAATLYVDQSSAKFPSHRSIFPNFLAAYGLDTVDGYVNLIPKAYASFWTRVLHPLLIRDQNIRKKWNTETKWVYLFKPKRFKYNDILVENIYNLKFLSLASTKYFFSTEPVTSDTLFPVVEEDQLYIYENKKSFPKFFVTSSFKRLKSIDEIWNYIEAHDLSHIRNSSLILADNKIRDFPDSGNAEIITVKTHQRVTSLRIKSDHGCILNYMVSYNKKWNAFLNGVKINTFPVYGAFLGASIPSGEHTIELKFRDSL